MTAGEIKIEIQRLLDNVPDNVLQDLLDYLKQAQKQTKDQIELSRHLKKILAEDKELLAKLAE
jgi:hypothetical protein